MQGNKYADIFTLEEIVSPLVALKSVIPNRILMFSSLHFLPCLPDVKKLEIDNCHSLNPYCFVIQLPKYAEHLVHLSLNGNFQLRKYDLIQMAKRLTNLKYLSMMDCDCLSVGGVETILKACTGLKTFMFSGLFFLDDAKFWVDLVEVKFPHVQFSKDVYDQIFWYKNFYLCNK